jgi:hypothetical protein
MGRTPSAGPPGRRGPGRSPCAGIAPRGHARAGDAGPTLPRRRGGRRRLPARPALRSVGKLPVGCSPTAVLSRCPCPCPSVRSAAAGRQDRPRRDRRPTRQEARMTTVTSRSPDRAIRPPARGSRRPRARAGQPGPWRRSTSGRTRRPERRPTGADAVAGAAPRLRDEGATGADAGGARRVHPAGRRRAPVAAFADADGRTHVEHLPARGEERATLGPFPHLSPLLTARHGRCR